MRAAAVLFLVACVGCGGSSSPASPTPSASPTGAPAPMTLSGTVFEVVPGARVPAPGVALTAVIVTPTSCAPPCFNKSTWVREETTSGPDGRYNFPHLPAGPVIVLTTSSAHQQVCGAATTLSATTQLDVEITSKSNPQPSPTMPPL